MTVLAGSDWREKKVMGAALLPPERLPRRPGLLKDDGVELEKWRRDEMAAEVGRMVASVVALERVEGLRRARATPGAAVWSSLEAGAMLSWWRAAVVLRGDTRR